MENKFIAIEGIDGAGKATQVREIKKYLEGKGKKVFVHKYPTENAGKIKDYLEGKEEFGEEELFELYLKDIADEQGELKGNLENGWVIADRYCISTAAYQGVGGKLGERVLEIEGRNLIKPDLVIWLDLSAEEGMERKRGQKKLDKHEGNLRFLRNVRENFRKLYGMKFMCEKWEKIDAAKDPGEVTRDIEKIVGV
ncbi:MAG: dTMP kinase [Candidatus Micrarchaeota archaeon]